MDQEKIDHQVRQWVSSLLWLQYKGSRWVKTESGKYITVRFDKEQRKEWFDNIPEEYRKIVRSVAIKEKKRFTELQKKTGKKYCDFMINEKIQL